MKRISSKKKPTQAYPYTHPPPKTTSSPDHSDRPPTHTSTQHRRRQTPSRRHIQGTLVCPLYPLPKAHIVSSISSDETTPPAIVTTSCPPNADSITTVLQGSRRSPRVKRSWPKARTAMVSSRAAMWNRYALRMGLEWRSLG